MSTPMYDVPKHLLIPVNENSQGPVPDDKAHHYRCWCEKLDCKEYL